MHQRSAFAGCRGCASTAAYRRAILTNFRTQNPVHACAAASSRSPNAVSNNSGNRERQPTAGCSSASDAASAGLAPAGPRRRAAGADATPSRAPASRPAPSSSSSPPSSPLPAHRPRKTPQQHASQPTPPQPSAAVASAAAAPPPAATSPSPDAASSSTPTSTTASDAGGLSPELLQRYQLSAHQHRQLEIYLDYLLEINQSMNLTAVRDKGDAWQRHVVDSLALLPVIERHLANSAVSRPAALSSSTAMTGAVSSSSNNNRNSSGVTSSSGADGGSRGVAAASAPAALAPALRVVDVGTGAGLPGMVLAVARPQWKVTLLDSLRKRCDFLREAAARAGLANVEVVWCRAEDGGHRPELRQAYDLAVARAVAEARVLAELCLPFVRVGGLWVAAKGPDPEAEVAAAASAIRQLGGRQVALERVESHSPEGQRTALVVAKTGHTPPRFPRQAGTPNKKPL